MRAMEEELETLRAQVSQAALDRLERLETELDDNRRLAESLEVRVGEEVVCCHVAS